MLVDMSYLVDMNNENKLINVYFRYKKYLINDLFNIKIFRIVF